MEEDEICEVSGAFCSSKTVHFRRMNYGINIKANFFVSTLDSTYARIFVLLQFMHIDLQIRPRKDTTLKLYPCKKITFSILIKRSLIKYTFFSS